MPYRDAGDTIADTLESIDCQSLKDFEVVAVDDHSEDDTREKLERAARRDPRIHLIDNPESGLVAALNAGLQTCSAGLVARMDADDIMHPDRLRRQSQFLTARPDIALAACQVALFPKHQIQDGYREYVAWQNLCLSSEDIANNLYVESPLAHPSVMFRREAVLRLGGYRMGPFPEDYDLWLRMHEAGLKMAKVPQVLLQWRESPRRASRVDHRYSREAFDTLRAGFLARDPRIEKAESIVVWGAGRRTRQRVRRLTQKGVRISAFVDIDPKKVGKTYDGALVRSRDWLAENRPSLVLIYVTNHGARQRIEDYLHTLQYRRGEDYLAVG